MKIENWPLSKIKPYPGNPRRNEKAVAAVAESIRQFGFRQPIVVDPSGVIIIGHTRRAAAELLKMKTAPVHVATDLSAAKIKALRIADNKTNELAEWDDEKLLATPEANDRKQIIYALLDAGMKAREVAQKVGVADTYVHKLRRDRPAGSARAPAPDPVVKVPAIDPLKPAAPQLEATAWSVVAAAAAGNVITVRQLNAAREIIKEAQRDKTPPPVNRKLRFIIEVIDVQDDDKIHVVGKNIYEVKP